MKNHKPIFSRGSRYVESAVNNWNKRSSRLIEAWYACNSTVNRKRIEKLILDLRDRMISLVKMLNESQKKQKFLKSKWEDYSYTRNAPAFCVN